MLTAKMALVIDCETTGLPVIGGGGHFLPPNETKYYDCSRLIELGYAIISKKDNTLNIKNQKSMLILPDNYVIKNSNIHGIEQDMAIENGKPINEIFDIFSKDLDKVHTVLAYNADFDVNVLLSEAYRYKCFDFIKKFKQKKFICVLKLARKKLKLKSYKLINVYNTLYNTDVKQKHRTEDDVKLCSEVFFKIKESN